MWSWHPARGFSGGRSCASAGELPAKVALAAACACAPTFGRRDSRSGRERANILAGSGFDSSPVGLAGYSVSGTFVAAGSDIGAELLAACRATVPGGRDSRLGVTSTPRVLVARYLGHSSQDAFRWFTSVWTVLRAALLGEPAIAPRLWAC
jgi:hypothetical protein